MLYLKLTLEPLKHIAVQDENAHLRQLAAKPKFIITALTDRVNFLESDKINTLLPKTKNNNNLIRTESSHRSQ